MKPKSCANVFVENMVRNSNVALRNEAEERIERKKVSIMILRHEMPSSCAYEGELLPL